MKWLHRLKRRAAVAPGPAPDSAAGAAAVDWKEHLCEHWELIDVLGSGGYSTVFRGRRHADGRTYAVKVTNLQALTEWSRRAAVREVQALAALTSGSGEAGTAAAFRHPCIATFREAFCLGSRLCIVTDPAPGGDLKHMIERSASRGGHLRESEVWSIFLQVTLALQHMHAHRFLHRDVKPQNVLLGSDGVVQLTDLGICGQLSSVFTRKEAGTPQFKAPEMWLGQPYSFSSDMWALGCVLYEMCAGRPLFDAPPGSTPEQAVESVRRQVLGLAAPPPLPAHIGPNLVEVLAVLLQPLPADRPSADELLARPAVAARLHDLPPAVQSCLAGAVEQRQRWQLQQQQQQQVAVDGGSSSGMPEPESFHPHAVNACLPPAAYPSGSKGALGTPRPGAQRQQPAPVARGRLGGRQPAGSSRESSGSSSSERATGSRAPSLASLDLAGLSSPAQSRVNSSSGRGNLVVVLHEPRSRPALLLRKSCSDFLATAASSTSVQI